MKGSRRKPLVVWYDDVKSDIEDWAFMLSHQKDCSMRVEIVTKYNDALELSQNGADCFLLDIRDKEEENRDGITLYHRIKERNFVVPAIFVTNYVDVYEKRLRKVAPKEYIVQKSRLDGSIVPRLSEFIFSKAYSHYEFEESGLEHMSYDEFIACTNRLELSRIHWRLIKDYVRHLFFVDRMPWIAICGRQKVVTGRRMSTFPDSKKKRKLSEQCGSMVFAYRTPIISEESSGLPAYMLNLYPKVQFRCSEKESYGYFDTGTNATIIDSRLSDIPKDASIQDDVFNGEEFEYAQDIISLDIIEKQVDQEKERIIKIPNYPVSMVLDWVKSPFISLDNKRRALFGRDMLKHSGQNVLLEVVGNEPTVHIKYFGRKNKGK